MILKNKTIFVTGIGKGIGKSICEVALQNGAFVYGLTRSKKDIKSIKKNENLKIYLGDTKNYKLIKKIFKDAKKDKRIISGLVNNAGIRFRKSFLKITKKNIYEVFDNNFFSVFNIIQEYVKYLGNKNFKNCSIVNIGSIVGKEGFAELSAYGSTKSALTGLTKCLSKELAKKKIRVNIINPGFIKTSYFKSFAKKKKLYNWTLSKIPNGKWGNSEDISQFVIFLLSEKSEYFNGEEITIDGGWTS
tara:strand:- start:238 stop:975 length:738 start_codon:yes stop_codon:yes gene_type:complete